MARMFTLLVALPNAATFNVAVGAGVGLAGFLGWAFPGVGPSEAAHACVARAPPVKVEGLKNALLFGGASPRLAFYCGAKVVPTSYAPLIQELLAHWDDPSAGVLVLQSPLNVYAFKPATVQEVLAAYPTVSMVAGHSIGGLWAAEYCRDMSRAGEWPEAGLDFFWMGVHAKTVSLAPFKEVPFRRVGWSYASNDVTMRNAFAEGEDMAAYVARIAHEQLPEGASCYAVDGGNHAQYGSYGAPGFAQGLAYNEVEATISEEAQRAIVAKAMAEIHGREERGD